MYDKVKPYVINCKIDLFTLKDNFACKLFGAKHFRSMEYVIPIMKSCKNRVSVEN